MKAIKGSLLAVALTLVLVSFGADLELLKELVAIPSSSADVREVNRSMQTTKACLERRGLFCTMETNENGNAILFASTKPGKEQDYVLSCHLDVVPASFEGHYALKNEGGRLTGRGVYDCKGMAVAVIDVLTHFAGSDKSIGCIFGADEELGGFTTTWMVEEKGYRPRKMVIVVDAAYKKLFYAQKGQLMVNVAQCGRGGHSSTPWKFDDSITKLMDGYTKLRGAWDLRHPKTADNWYDALTPTVVKSEGQALNRMPDRVELNLNLRSVSPEAKDELVKLCGESFPGAEVTVVRYSPPYAGNPGDPHIQRLKAAMEETFGETVPLDRALAASDARCFVSCPVPMAIVGIEGGDPHGSNEWATADGIDKVSAYLTKFLEAEPCLKAGCAKVDITPPRGVTMPGYYRVRYVDGALDPLSIVALAFSDGASSAVILQVDTAHIAPAVADGMRSAIVEATGLGRDAIIIHASHTHTGGNLSPGNPLDPPARPEAVESDRLYAKQATARAAEAAVAALADLRPARLSFGRSKAPRISFGRNYMMKDGKVRTNPGVGNPDIVRPVGEADETVQVLRIDRDGAKAICVINFQTHPDVIGGESVSADWPGLTRTAFETATSGAAQCIVLNGAQGDVNHVNVRPHPGEFEGLHRDFDDVDRGYVHAQRMANVIATAALSVWPACEPLVSGPVRAGGREVRVPAHKAQAGDAKGLAWAEKVWATHEAGRDAELPWKGMELTTEIARAQRIRRMAKGDEFHVLPLSAVAIGDAVTFGGFPGEPFNAIGVDIRARSPSRLTMLMCMANGSRGYFPTAASFEQDGYEAAACPFGPSVAADLTRGMLSLFGELTGGCAVPRAAGSTSRKTPLTVTAAGDAFMVQSFPKGYRTDERLLAWIGAGDARLVNFEAVVNDGACRPAAWSGGTWASTDPSVLPDFLSFGFNGCGCANNHSLDFTFDGLRLTQKTLRAAKVPFAGIGENLQEATAPAYVETPAGRVAFVSVNSRFHPDALAGWKTSRSPGRPGLNGLRHKETLLVTEEQMSQLKLIARETGVNAIRELNQRTGFTPPDAPGTFVFGENALKVADKPGRTSVCDERDLKRITDAIREARGHADAVIVLAHSHEIRDKANDEPAAFFVAFCHAAVEAGADAVIGGGTHELKGIEFHCGKPIFYSLGDFVFQNSVVPLVPPDFCEQFKVPLDADAKTAFAARSKDGKVGLHKFRENFLSVVPKIEFEGGRVMRVTMLPIELHFGCDGSVNGLPRTADAAAAKDIGATLARLSAPFGTRVELGADGFLTAREAK